MLCTAFPVVLLEVAARVLVCRSFSILAVMEAHAFMTEFSITVPIRLCGCRELRAKDLERLNNFVDDLKAKEKRGFSKEQKEELACAEKVRDFVLSGTDVR